MAIVITVPRDSALQFRLVVGANPETGAPIVNSKTFTRVKSAALDQDVYDTATALVDLQKYTVDEIRLEKESQLLNFSQVTDYLSLITVFSLAKNLLLRKLEFFFESDLIKGILLQTH